MKCSQVAGVDERAKREGVGAIVMVLASVMLASGVGLVSHSVGWFLITLPIAFYGIGAVRNYGR